jgi:hypothetical protein
MRLEGKFPIAGEMSNAAYFPTSPESAMLASRKQQLAHLQTLQLQQQQVLQQMSGRNASSPVSMMMGAYVDGRDDAFTASGMRLAPYSPGGSAVSFAPIQPPLSPSSPRRTTFECDYDINPTALYLAVQRKDWATATNLAGSSAEEASTWVSRKEGDGKLRWRLLPLHAAIIFRAPEHVISALISAFSQGAACKDDQGMLPLHLAFRNGCDGEVVTLLLMAYPQSIDVQDRKGRTPMVLAQQSTHANRDMYISALEKGPAYYAVASAAKDGNMMSIVPAGYQMPAATPSTMMWSNASPTAAVAGSGATGNERIAELEAELSKTQETSQVLVDHVNGLEAQLASRTDTERFLATKIASLDKEVKATQAELEEAKSEIETKKLELAGKDDEAAEEARKFELQIAELNAALKDKKAAELMTYKLTNKERFDLEERVETSERECAAAQATATLLETQLRKKIEIEQSLASQVSMLASQLASSASTSSEASTAHQRACESLTAENKKLHSYISELETKLATVATALDAMAAEQEGIVLAAASHSKTIEECVQAHQTIFADTVRQETLLEEAAKEREQIVSILMRQAEDAERTMSDRERVLEAVKAQEAEMTKATEERNAVIESVSKQREYMDFVLNGELAFLKRTASEDKCDLVKVEKMQDMETKLAAYKIEKEAAKDEEEDANIGVVRVSDDAGFESANEEAVDEDEIDAAVASASSEDSDSSDEE